MAESKGGLVWSWLLESGVFLLIYGGAGGYGFLHLGRHVPMAALWEPLGVLSVLIFAFGPLLYWARGRPVGSNRRIACAVSGYFGLGGGACVHYSAKLGLLEPGDAAGMYTFVALMVIAGCLLGHKMAADFGFDGKSSEPPVEKGDDYRWFF